MGGTMQTGMFRRLEISESRRFSFAFSFVDVFGCFSKFLLLLLLSVDYIGQTTASDSSRQ